MIKKYIQNAGTKEEIAIWEIFHNNPNLQSISGRILKTGELKGKLKLDIVYKEKP